MDVWREEETAVGDRSSQIAELERGDGNVALSHPGPQDGSGLPSCLVAACEIVHIGHQAAFLPRHVDA